MEQSSKGKVELTSIDAMILAFGQLLQPATASEVFEFANGTVVREALSKKKFLHRFSKLEREGFFWRTEEGKFVVTPKGDRLAVTSLNYKKRDKLRLLILNERRYKNA